jgi:ribose transport system substrate-binding protein
MKQVTPVTLAAIVIGILGVAGCRPGGAVKVGSSGNTPGKSAKNPSIVIVPGGQNEAFWKSMRQGAEHAGRMYGATIVWSKTADRPVLEDQKKLVREATANKVDGILLAPVARVGMVPPIDKAAKARSPIVSLVSGADTFNQLATVSSDSDEVGTLAASRIGEVTGGKGKVGLVINQSKSLTIGEREIAFSNALARQFPDVQLLSSHSGLTDLADVGTGAARLVSLNPDLKAMVGFDGESTMAALTALRNQKALGRVKLIGFDATEPLVAAAKRGEIDSLFVQSPYQMGYQGVKAVMDYLGGQRPPKRITTAVTLATKDKLGNVLATTASRAMKAEKKSDVK